MWAKFISYIFHPAIVPFIGVLSVYFLLPYHIPETLYYFVLAYVFAGTYLFPLIIVLGMVKLNLIESIHLRKRSERFFPFLITAFFYFLTARAVAEFHFPLDLSKFIFAGCLIAIIQLLFLKWTKLSAHAAGASAVLTWFIILSYHYQINLLLPIVFSILALSMVSSARLKLKAHTTSEIIGGILTGMVAVLLVYQ